MASDVDIAELWHMGIDGLAQHMNRRLAEIGCRLTFGQTTLNGDCDQNAKSVRAQICSGQVIGAHYSS